MLNKRWKEILYAFSAFGPNLVMIAMMAYFTDAVDPTFMIESHSSALPSMSFNSTIIVAPILFGILWTIGRVFDGFIDVPFASLTDKMKNKYARVTMPILIGVIPMILGAVLMCVPIVRTAGSESIINTVWFFVMGIIFFAFYTLTLIAFYGSLSSVCTDHAQRKRISFFKSFFDTVAYALVYAVLNLIISPNFNILSLLMCLSPLMLTILIPVFLFRKADKRIDTDKEDAAANPDAVEVKEEKAGVLSSLALVFTNKKFLSWLAVNCISFFGLQLFLAAQNVLVVSVLGIDKVWMTLLNTAAFGPVPLTLILFNRAIKKRGVRFAAKTAMLSFAVGILGFFFGSQLFWGSNLIPKLVFASVGGTISSYAIGAFFSMPVMITSQVGAVDREVTGKSNSGMYFAGQALATTVFGALSTGIVYAFLKQLPVIGGSEATELKLGSLLVPIIVSVCCLIAFGFAFLMPKNFDKEHIGDYFVKQEELNKQKAERRAQFAGKEEEGESLQNGLAALKYAVLALVSSILGATIVGVIVPILLGLRAVRSADLSLSAKAKRAKKLTGIAIFAGFIFLFLAIFIGIYVLSITVLKPVPPKP